MEAIMEDGTITNLANVLRTMEEEREVLRMLLDHTTIMEEDIWEEAVGVVEVTMEEDLADGAVEGQASILDTIMAGIMEAMEGGTMEEMEDGVREEDVSETVSVLDLSSVATFTMDISVLSHNIMDEEILN